MIDGATEQSANPTAATAPATIKRRWFRFSLRTLVIFVLLVGSGMGLWWKWEPWEDREVGDNTKPITCAAFSPGADYVAIGSKDHTVQVWTVSGRESLTLVGHTGSITAIRWCPTGRLLATGSSDGTVRLWDFNAARLAVTIELADQTISDIAFANNGRFLAIGANSGYACVWSLETNTELARLSGHNGAINQIAFSGDDLRVATASDDGFVAVFDTLSGAELSLIDMTTEKGYSTPAYCVAFSNRGDQLATCDDSGSLRVWDISMKNPTTPRARTGSVASAVCFSRDDRKLFVADSSSSWHQSGGRSVWNLESLSWQRLETLPDDTPNLAFRPLGYDYHLVAVSEGMKWSAAFFQHPTSPMKSSPLHLRHLRRPEYWYGLAWLPEFWLTVVFAGMFVWSVRRDRKTL